MIHSGLATHKNGFSNGYKSNRKYHQSNEHEYRPFVLDMATPLDYKVLTNPLLNIEKPTETFYLGIFRNEYTDPVRQIADILSRKVLPKVSGRFQNSFVPGIQLAAAGGGMTPEAKASSLQGRASAEASAGASGFNTDTPEVEHILAVERGLLPKYEKVQIVTNAPLYLDPEDVDVKLNVKMITEALRDIGRQLLAEKKVVETTMIPDPEYLDKLTEAIKIAKEYESKSPRERFIIATNAMQDGKLMKALMDRYMVKDVYKTGEEYKTEYSPELINAMIDLVRRTPVLNPITEYQDLKRKREDENFQRVVRRRGGEAGQRDMGPIRRQSVSGGGYLTKSGKVKAISRLAKKASKAPPTSLRYLAYKALPKRRSERGQ